MRIILDFESSLSLSFCKKKKKQVFCKKKNKKLGLRSKLNSKFSQTLFKILNSLNYSSYYEGKIIVRRERKLTSQFCLLVTSLSCYVTFSLSDVTTQLTSQFCLFVSSLRCYASNKHYCQHLHKQTRKINLKQKKCESKGQQQTRY